MKLHNFFHLNSMFIAILLADFSWLWNWYHLCSVVQSWDKNFKEEKGHQVCQNQVFLNSDMLTPLFLSRFNLFIKYFEVFLKLYFACFLKYWMKFLHVDLLFYSERQWRWTQRLGRNTLTHTLWTLTSAYGNKRRWWKMLIILYCGLVPTLNTYYWNTLVIQWSWRSESNYLF